MWDRQPPAIPCVLSQRPTHEAIRGWYAQTLSLSLSSCSADSILMPFGRPSCPSQSVYVAVFNILHLACLGKHLLFESHFNTDNPTAGHLRPRVYPTYLKASSLSTLLLYPSLLSILRQRSSAASPVWVEKGKSISVGTPDRNTRALPWTDLKSTWLKAVKF